MNYWKLECVWRHGMPDFYSLLKEKRIVICGDHPMAKDDWVLICQGYDAVALAKIGAAPVPSTARADLWADFERLQIIYDESNFVADIAEFYELTESERFQYQQQKRICRINNPEICGKIERILTARERSVADSVDYGLAIPESDQEFVILPDKAKVRFESTGPLMKYLDDEIAAWDGVDFSIQQKYKSVRNILGKIVKSHTDASLPNGALHQLHRELSAVVLDSSNNTIRSCVNSKSKLGQLLASYHEACRGAMDVYVYRSQASAAFCVAMGYRQVDSDVTATWALGLVDAAVRLRSGDALASDISGYRKEFESLAALGVQQRADYDGRIADFEAKKAALDDSAKKFEQDYQDRIKTLEDTYTKLLQLKGPAEYWDALAKSYRNRGWGFMGIAFLSGAVVFGWLMALLMDAECLPLFEHTKFDAAAIRGSLIFVALMSVAGYLLHLFTRIAISSFHLSRDYRERFQLTRVYLALIKDGDIANDENTRQIVLQSIFSRSDTGLLKGDHALTMPVALGDVGKGNG